MKLTSYLIGCCFLLSNNAVCQLYQDLAENDSKIKDETFISFLTGFSYIPVSYESAYVNVVHNSFPDIDTTLPEVAFSNGFNFGTAGHFPGDWYLNFNLSMVFSSSQEGRKNDNAGFVTLGIGKEFPLVYESKNYILSLETGVGFSALKRPFATVDRVRSELSRSNFIVTPAVVFDVNLHKERIFFYVSGRYVYNIADFKSGIWRQDRRRSNNPTSITPFDGKVDEAAYLDIGNLFEFAIGLRFKFRDRNPYVMN